jgi:hypothetical protein
MSNRIHQLQKLVKEASSLHIDSKLLDYSGVVEYYPEELVMAVKAGTPIAPFKNTPRVKHHFKFLLNLSKNRAIIF